MKKSLLITLLLLPFLGFSQTTKPIEGFLGIKFGSSRAEVVAAMKAKGAVYRPKASEKDIADFGNVKLGHRVTDDFYVRFLDDKVFEANYVFKPEAEGKLRAEYSDLIDDLNGIYGKGDVANKFSDPYTKDDSDGDILVGISVGKIDFMVFWEDANKNSIAATISTDMTISLQYQDSKLTDEAIKKQKAKEKSDF